MDACREAGLNVPTFIIESIAATCAFGWNTMGWTKPKRQQVEHCIVFRAGGSSVNVSIVEFDNFKKVAQARASNEFSGRAIDERVAFMLMNELQDQNPEMDQNPNLITNEIYEQLIQEAGKLKE